ncbi:MAG: Bug family tripartite tricarboxylate transporter substrate binding protein [Burkholderiaceae bacterium]
MLKASLACFLFGTTVSVAHAQGFPDKPVQFVVPLPPGGSVDALARELAAQLAKRWGQSVVVDNKPGASNIIGAGFVARAPKDGYTALLGVSGLTSLPYLYQKLPFDIEKDFAPVALVARMPFVVVVPQSSPANSLAEFIALAKANPATLSYGSYGNGTAAHLAAAKLANQAGIDLIHVPYKGSAPALTDLVAGRISLMIMDIGPTMPYVKSGRLKALAVTSLQQTPLVPELPTVSDSGLRGYEAGGWFGVFLPGGTPTAIVNRYNSELAAILEAPETRKRIFELGLETATSSPAQLAERMKNDSASTGALIRKLGIRPND